MADATSNITNNAIIKRQYIQTGSMITVTANCSNVSMLQSNTTTNRPGNITGITTSAMTTPNNDVNATDHTHTLTTNSVL
eukprot:6956393-Pyramimonas_sp.AAC.1